MEIYLIKKETAIIFKKFQGIINKKEFKDNITELKTIEIESQENQFWDNPKIVSIKLKRQSQLKRLINHKLKLEEIFENFSMYIELFEEGDLSETELLLEYKSLNDAYQNFELIVLLNGDNDDFDVIIEINPGAGGVESQDWAEMLYEMYNKYAQKENLQVAILNLHKGETAGIKNITFEIKGSMLYGKLKNESGIHRLVRMSPFDSANRRHTSFAAVKVTPLIEGEIDIEIKQTDLRIDTYRSSGAGGQSVNTTDSAVRITHLPTKTVVSCQNERSQLRNKDKALKILKIKLYELEQIKNKDKKNKFVDTNNDIAFGSQKRSYILHPYKMVKDHDSGYESSQPDKVLSGEIDEFIYNNLIK